MQPIDIAQTAQPLFLEAPAPFSEYPDAVNVAQMAKMLGVSEKTAYKLLKDGKIRCVRVGREYRALKQSIVEFLYGQPSREPAGALPAD